MSETKSTYWEDRAKRLKADREKLTEVPPKAAQKLVPVPPAAGSNPPASDAK